MCPVCLIRLKRGTTNIELNQHVDRCLGQAGSTEVAQVISDDEIEIIEVSDVEKPEPKRSKAPGRIRKPNKRRGATDKKDKSDKANELQNAFSLMMPRK